MKQLGLKQLRLFLLLTVMVLSVTECFGQWKIPRGAKSASDTTALNNDSTDEEDGRSISIGKLVLFRFYGSNIPNLCRHCVPPRYFSAGLIAMNSGNIGFDISGMTRIHYYKKIASNLFYLRESAGNDILLFRCSPLSKDLIPGLNGQSQYLFYNRLELNNSRYEDLCIMDEYLTFYRVHSYRAGFGFNRYRNKYKPLLCLGYGYNNNYAFRDWIIYSDLFITPDNIDIDSRILYSLIGENFKLGARYFRFCNRNFVGLGIQLYFTN